MRFLLSSVLFGLLFLAAGCSGDRVFLRFSAPDGTPLQGGDLTVRYGYEAGVIRDPSGVAVPEVRDVAERFSACRDTVSFLPPGEVVWLTVDAIYPGYLPLHFRIDRAAPNAPRLYELSEIDPHYVPSDLTIVGEKERLSVSATLRFP